MYYGLHYTKSEFWEGICFVHFLPLSFLLGPSLFYYVKHTVSEDKSFGVLDGLHLLPAVFVGIACLPFTTLPLDVKTRMAHEIVNITEDYNLPFRWVSFEQLLYGRSIHVLMYAGLSLGYFFWNKRQLVEKYGIIPTNHRVIQRWFFTLVAFQVIIACTSLGHMITLYTRPFSIFGLSFVEIFSEEHFFRICGGGFFIQNFFLFLYPNILYGNISYTEDLAQMTTLKKLKSSLTKQVKSNGFEEDLEALIHPYLAENPFIKSNFTLSQMSFDLKVPERFLSNYFNQELNKTFGEWKNDLRIRYACQLIEEGSAKKLTLEAISTEAGFVSRSKFIDAFKARMGLTPSAYIKKMQGT